MCWVECLSACSSSDKAKIILLAQPLLRCAIYRSGVQVAGSLVLCPCGSGWAPWPAVLSPQLPIAQLDGPGSTAQPSPSQVQRAAPFQLATENKQPEKGSAGPSYLSCCSCLLCVTSVRHDRPSRAHPPCAGSCSGAVQSLVQLHSKQNINQSINQTA